MARIGRAAEAVFDTLTRPELGVTPADVGTSAGTSTDCHRRRGLLDNAQRARRAMALATELGF
jgi:hypothetical protein